jgi:hypothetical protein
VATAKDHTLGATTAVVLQDTVVATVEVVTRLVVPEATVKATKVVHQPASVVPQLVATVAAMVRIQLLQEDTTLTVSTYTTDRQYLGNSFLTFSYIWANVTQITARAHPLLELVAPLALLPLATLAVTAQVSDASPLQA